MIEVVHPYKKVWSMYTLASLLPDKEKIRLHLYIHEDDWAEAPVEWILENFPTVKIYQTFWLKNQLATTMCHLLDHWKDKGGLHKRIVWLGGNNIISGRWSDNLPGPDFFQSVSYLAHKRVFRKHPRFLDFYRILRVAINEQKPENISTEFALLNYDLLKNFDPAELFCPTETDELETRVPGMPAIDRLLYKCRDEAFVSKLLSYQHKFMPLYMTGQNDVLIEKDAMGPLDCINYNVMLRKSFQLNIEHKWLIKPYLDLPTGVQLSLPWDMYSNLISSIPVNHRNAINNEILLLKSAKQKRAAGSLLKAGFKLGKI